MVDTYTIHSREEFWECGDGCCQEWTMTYTVEYKDFPSPVFDTEEEALYYILEREGVKVMKEHHETY